MTVSVFDLNGGTVVYTSESTNTIRVGVKFPDGVEVRLFEITNDGVNNIREIEHEYEMYLTDRYGKPKASVTKLHPFQLIEAMQTMGPDTSMSKLYNWLSILVTDGKFYSSDNMFTIINVGDANGG